ncbi:11231_t:CDS:2, partial [Entrophospora sp. SA101]
GLQFSKCLSRYSSVNPYDSIINFVNISNVVDKQVFCCDASPDYNSQIELPGDLCGGILGDTISINAVIGDCPAPSTVSNALTTISLFG